jgi:hypothetical protein
MRVFVTGATGLSVLLSFRISLVQDLIKAGHEAAGGLLARKRAPQSDMVRYHVTRAPGTVWSNSRCGCENLSPWRNWQ